MWHHIDQIKTDLPSQRLKLCGILGVKYSQSKVQGDKIIQGLMVVCIYTLVFAEDFPYRKNLAACAKT